MLYCASVSTELGVSCWRYGPPPGVNACHVGSLGVNLDQTSGQPRELQFAEITLSDQIVGAWTRFAKTGNPNGPRLPTWQAFTPGKGPFLQQDIPNSVETDAQYNANYNCEFWASQEASQ